MAHAAPVRTVAGIVAALKEGMDAMRLRQDCEKRPLDDIMADPAAANMPATAALQLLVQDLVAQVQAAAMVDLLDGDTPGQRVSVGERDGQHVVLLDQRPIKTPDGRVVQIAQQQRALAWLVAGEWEAQKEVVGTHSLPLTSLVSRALDGLADPGARGEVIDKLLKYFQTDSVCLHDAFPRALVELQQQHYAPILAWARAAYGIEIRTTGDLFALRQAPEAVAALREAAAAFSPLKLAALERATMAAKSFLIGLALVEQRITAEEAALAAQVEANAQTRLWGELENAHDLDNAAIRQILGAAACAAADA